MAALGAFVVAAITVSPLMAAPSLEDAVKASYLFKFGPFVDWPPSTFANTGGSFQICISGQDPFGSVMDEVVRGQRIHGRPVTVRRLSGASPLDCQILFLGKPTKTDAKMPSDVAGQPILTVADADDGTTSGMIEFVLQGGRVRFQIDDGAARASGLRISSKLLGLAVAVDKR